ncbi:MAG: DUF362 domain-containing protein [Lachnospiraceae bacterium]|nr:DUF362 domain-containing protein [Lachnospiraceae bacterium]
MKRNEIWRSYGTDFKNMTIRLLEMTGLAERIPGPQAKIAIKPNLVTPAPADFGGTTHTEVVAGIIEYLQGHGFRNIVIAEGSWVGDKTAEAFEYCGFRTLSENYGVPLIDTQKEKSVPADCAGMKLSICRCVQEWDFLINVPVLKGHCQTHMTCALKNMKGLIPNSEKRRFHTIGLHKPIAHLNTGIRPDFIVIDHICGDPSFEEGGNPLVRNCVMAALDPVMTDAYACSLLGLETDDVPYVRMAERLGVGSADLSSLRLITCEGDPAEDVPMTQSLLDVSYAVDESDSCSACYGTLIPALERLKEEGLLEKLPCPIAIGQGHRGKSGPLGVGNCTRGYDFSIPGCPPGEEKIYEMLKTYIEDNSL